LPIKIDKPCPSKAEAQGMTESKLFIRAKIRLNTLRHFEQSKAFTQQIPRLQTEFMRNCHALEADSEGLDLEWEEELLRFAER
jgi:hypothetical protein